MGKFGISLRIGLFTLAVALFYVGFVYFLKTHYSKAIYYEPTLCLDSLYETYDEKEFIPQKPKYIIIHCTAVPPTFSFTPETLLSFFKNSRKWDRPGYRHFVSRDGKLHTLRNFNGNEYIDYDEITYGASGLNAVSVHIAYDGGLDNNKRPKDTRTEAQKVALETIISFYKSIHPDAKVIGHRNVSKKACPSFDAKDEYKHIKGHLDIR